MLTLILLSVFGAILSDLLANLLNIGEIVDRTRIEKYCFWELFLYGVVLIPILEEVAFRLYLFPRKIAVVTSVSFFAYLFSSRIIFNVESINFTSFILERLFVSLGFGVFAYLTMLKVSDNSLKQFYERNFGLIFYFSALLFGVVHISNYSPMNITTLLLSPLLTLHQVISGLGFGYIRVREGFVYAILFHSIVNLIPTLTALF